MIRKLLAATLLLAAVGAQAQATLDQNKALAGNVTPGDTPGFPITLSVSGHYKLMGNLNVPAGVAGIVLKAPSITLDLNGFTIGGPGECVQNASTYKVSCSGVSTGSQSVAGVRSEVPGAFTVRNGRVRGFWYGVILADGVVLEDLVAEHNAFAGVDLQQGSRVRGLTAGLNGSYGLVCQGCLISESTLMRNGGEGLSADWVTRVNNSVFTKNGGYGLEYGVLRGNSFWDNKLGAATKYQSLGGNNNNGTLF